MTPKFEIFELCVNETYELMEEHLLLSPQQLGQTPYG